MESSSNISKALVIIYLLLLLCFPHSAHCHSHQAFLQCLLTQQYSKSQSSNISNIIYTTESSSYRSILQNPIKNLRFKSSSTPKPVLIITPEHESQIQAVVFCSKAKDMQIRTRSGGHDYEGLSYTSSRVPFVVLDMINMSVIKINAERKTAWIQTGATIGQLYYKISQESKKLAFPAGTCPTVGVGGHFSGGGYGTLMREYGLSADNIIDARIIDANGKILNRKSMGEDLFWAIRGGGGASFGVITAWKVKLVTVPETVTVFHVKRTLEQNATMIFHRWQYVSPFLPKDLFLSVDVRSVNLSSNINGGNKNNKNIEASFNSLFLGGVDELLKLLHEKFPELGVMREDCKEVNWVQSTLSFSGYSIDDSPQVLASRVPLYKIMYFKAKSDYVQEPIPEYAIEGIWKLFYEKEAENAVIIFTPYGGKMSEIPESSVPFPHRSGNLYKIQHLVYWDEPGERASEKHISWIRKLYRYMAPYVSKSPRAAYLNYRDLDLGVNDDVRGNTSYAQASKWGLKYYKNNFDRLIEVKTVFDPGNFFRNEQSIPSLNMVNQ